MASVRALAFAVAGAIAALTTAGALAAGTDGAWAPPAADVFDTLADNAWYLRTADGAARLYVTEFGRGPTVVVLHGGAGGDFGSLVDALRPAAGRRRFVLFDQRGSVLSPVPEARRAGLTIDLLVDDLETLRVALHEQRLTLLAHSFGTLLAMRYLERHPDRVAGLLLAGSFPPATPDGGLKAQVAAMRARAKALSARPEVGAVLKAEGLDGDPARLDPRARSARDRIVGFADFDLVHVERWRQLQGGGVFYDAQVDDAVGDSVAASYDVRPVLAAHHVPVAVVQGERDYVDPGAAAWRGVAAALHVVPDASHYPWIDAPRAFDDALSRSLDEIARAASP